MAPGFRQRKIPSSDNMNQRHASGSSPNASATSHREDHSMPQAGDRAPEFQLSGHDGNTVSLANLRGQKVVLYFYPKDDTPGCTTQACGIRDSIDEFDARGATVLGVSPDPVKAHVKFRDKYDLNFALLADPDHAVCEAYGVWKEKSMYGRKYMGVERTTFVIDGDGVISAVQPKVKPASHVADVLGLLG
jgi:peroxiredoxin Q/BCP